jgi:hypothetical protein
LPTLGQRNDELLTRLLGYDRAMLDELWQAKVIAHRCRRSAR